MIKLIKRIFLDERGVLLNLPQEVQQAGRPQQGGLSTQALLGLLLQKQQADEALKVKERLQQQKLQDPFEQLRRKGQIATSAKAIDEIGGDVSPFRELLTGSRLGAGREAPIDLDRLALPAAGGGFSTENTIGINVDGREINIPTIVNGQQLTEEQAIQAFSEGRNPPVGEFATQAEADTAAPLRSKRIGELRGGGKIRKRPQLTATEFEQLPLGGVRPTKIVSLKGQKKVKLGAAQAAAAGKQIEATVKAIGNVSRIRSALKGLVGTGKQTALEQGGFGAIQTAKGVGGRFLAKAGVEKFITGKEPPPEKQFSGFDAFKGQLVEVTLALSPILTGQNRIIEGVVRMLGKTVPNFPTTEASFTAKLKQTAKNSFRVSLALAKGTLSLEEIEALNNADEAEIDETLRGVLARSDFSEADKAAFEEFWNGIKATPATKAEGLFEREQEGRGKVKGIIRRFNSVEEAEAEDLPVGTIISIGGRRARVE